MRDYDIQKIKNFTDIEPEERKRLIRYFAKLPEKIQIEAIKIQMDLIGQRREQEERTDNAPIGALSQPEAQLNQVEFSYTMLIAALHKIRSAELAPKRQIVDRTQAIEATKKTTDIRIARILAEKTRKAKRNVKFRLIKLKLYEKIKDMQKKGLSYKDISRYIAKFHRVKITPGYIQATMKKIATERQNEPI